MAGTSMPGGLSERLRKRREEDERRIGEERQRLEELITSEFGKLGEHVSSAVANAQNSIENDLAAGIARTGALLRKAWVRTLATAISLLLGILIGSWGLTQWLSFRVQTLLELESRIAEQELTLELLEGKTWGLELHEAENGNYIVLPRGSRTLDHNGRPTAPVWSVGGHPAIKLSLP